MTTAHRATWKAARGGLHEEGSFQLHVPSAAVSSKDAPTERVLKSRDVDPASRDELRARLDLPAARRKRLIREDHPTSPSRSSSPVKRLRLRDKTPEQGEQGEQGEQERQDGDENDDEASEEEDDDDSDSDDESSEDEAELLAEMERIRKERAVQRAKRDAAAEHQRIATDNPLLSNNMPASSVNDDFSDTASLATHSVAFSVRRRWDDDLIFRNQAGRERQPAPRFINDTIHNDFHKRFMRRYMR